MRQFLRTTSTPRLLAVLGGAVLAVGGGTAIAVAAGSGGPVPAGGPKPLAGAIHAALTAPPVRGFSARITFTNRLIDSSNIVGTDPLLNGASGRIWIAPHKLRLELQNNTTGNGDAQIVVANGRFSAYDPAFDTVYEGTLPQPAAAKRSTPDAIPTVAEIQAQISQLLQSADLTKAIPGDVGGQPAYTVSISPKHSAGLLGSASLAWDAVRGVPLDLSIYAAGQASPVLELRASKISYGAIDPSVFAVQAPAGAKVMRIATPKRPAGGEAKHAHSGKEAPQTAAQVQAQIPFTLTAPGTLVGLPRHSVSVVEIGKQAKGALVTYGQNLGGLLVFEQAATAGGAAIGKLSTGSGEGRNGLSLPTVSINGATGQELDTALGTLVRFTKGGITYTVLGSVPPAAADAAARAL